MIVTVYTAGVPFISEDPEDLYRLEFVQKCHKAV